MHYNKRNDKISYLENIINDLVLLLSMHIQDYPFDNDHIAKQKELIIKAYKAIGMPITIEEMAIAIAWSK